MPNKETHKLSMYPQAHRGVRVLWVFVIVVTIAACYGIIVMINGTKQKNNSSALPSVFQNPVQTQLEQNKTPQSSSENLNPFEDADNDGLLNMQESQYQTDPRNADSDGDGYNDGEEVRTGHNPVGK